LKLTITGASTPTGSLDVEIDAPADLTVGELASQLGERSEDLPSDAATLALGSDATARLCDPERTLQQAGIASGAIVEPVGSSTGVAVPPTGQPVAELVVVDGPGRGTRHPLRAGANTVGRDASCDVVLADDMVSRRHLRIEVGRTVEVVDLGAANGTIVAGRLVPRAHLEPTTEVLVGATTVRVEVHVELSDEPTGAFVRSPLTSAQLVTDELAAPSPPSAGKPGRIPIIAALAPVILGAGMFALTRRVESLLFIALSPIMLLGNAVESRWSNRKGARKSAAEFRREIAEFSTEARRRLGAETDARRSEHPELPDLVSAARRRTPLLWSRRPDGAHFAELSLGRGEQPSRHTFTSPRTDQAPDELVVELNTAMHGLDVVHDVPVTVDLSTEGSVGVAGPAAEARAVTGALVASFVTMHSPAEATVAVMTPESAEASWRWLRWLPHVDDAHAPIDTPLLASTTPDCTALQGGLLALIDARERSSNGRSEVRHLPLVLLVIEDDAPLERSLLVELLERGPAAGVHVLWTAAAVDRLPAGCGAVVDAARGPLALAARVRRTSDSSEGVRLLTLAPGELDRLARTLSPIVDVGARPRKVSGLPALVAGPELLGIDATASPDHLLERWAQTSIEAARDRDTGLRAPVGIADGEPFVLDLRTHGPHALVGGTTGAGKSEFLQAWVIGLDANHSAARVNFLFVDYKGGSAFSECVKLPHCVGLVTDLSPHLVDRSLTSLHAELQRREHLFNRLDAKDIHELERRGAPETPPALLIVVDEFAALVQEVPDFVDGVVNVAQRGRSLGLHLVLATQRPAGVITGNLRANTNLRVALRMADESDSSDVIDEPDAAFLDATHPGRGYAKVGPGRIVAFQSAFYGGWSDGDDADRRITVRPLDFGRVDPWPTARRSAGLVERPNDLARLVALTQRASLVGQVPAPRRPWLPELPSGLDLREAQLTRSDAELVVGTRDLPAEQAQPSIAFFPDADGNLAVFGASGSGKSALLRTIAIVAGTSTPGTEPGSGPCHVQCIDFGSRSLQPLEDFSHVGSVIGPDDTERIDRLVRELRARVEDRQLRYRSFDADSIVQYRERSGDTSEPRLLLVIDNFGAFHQAHDQPDRVATWAMLTSIMADGRAVGVHLVVSADRPGALPSAVTSMISRRLVLRLSTESDYLLLGEPSNVLSKESPPGRGIEHGREFQVAVLGGTTDLAEQTRLARVLARHEGFGAGSPPAAPIRRLPTSVALAELPVEVAGRPTLGLDDATLTPVGFEPRGAFV
ncbi:MAG: FtsK/SpoIIIE domain-containing protein, partial [Actinomycetota bacterium]